MIPNCVIKSKIFKHSKLNERIFIINFLGNTTDYDGMVRHVTTRYPTTKIICIGFSMGGNIVTKYLGEKKSIPQIIAGISACQVIINTCYKVVHWTQSPILGLKHANTLHFPYRDMMLMSARNYYYNGKIFAESTSLRWPKTCVPFYADGKSSYFRTK